MTAVATKPSDTNRSSVALWVGRVISALPVLALVASGAGKISHAPKFVDMFTGHFGFSVDALTPIGILEIACALVYVIPRTAFFGAVLVTAYLGGAVATHVRVGDAFAVPVILGVLVWLGLYLRDNRLRALAPLRSLPHD
jgi:DoxX-like family